MTELSRQPKDKNYNLISVLYQSSDNVELLLCECGVVECAASKAEQ